MGPSGTVWERGVWWCACGSGVAALFSIAISQILLGAALLCFVVGRIPLRFPPIKLQLALFVFGTVLALMLSSDPRAGLPQLKKFYVFLMLPVIYSAVRNPADVLRLIYTWAAVATASGLWSFVQFWRKRSAALRSGHNFYSDYVADRVTGIYEPLDDVQRGDDAGVTTALRSAFLRAPCEVEMGLSASAGAVMGGALTIALTCSVWLATLAGLVYLVAAWRPKLLLLTPVVLGVFWLSAPGSVKERVVSIYYPHGTLDSNEHRYITRRVGWEMIKAHPWFGIGPEVGREFMHYLPADIHRPLPEAYYGHLHNIYLQYAAERGLPTLGCVSLAGGDDRMSQYWQALRRLAADDTVRRAILHGAIAAVLAILVEGLGEHNLGDSEVLSMFLTVVAWGYVAAADKEFTFRRS